MQQLWFLNRISKQEWVCKTAVPFILLPGGQVAAVPLSLYGMHET